MKIIKWLDDNLEEIIMTCFLTIIFVIVCAQVFMRYVLLNSPSWTEELVRYMFIWMVFFGFSVGVKRNNHIQIFALYNKFSPKSKLWISLASNALFFVFCVIIATIGIEELKQLTEFHQKSAALEIPMYFVHAASPIGISLTALRLIQATVRLLRGYGNDPAKQDNPI